MQQENKKESNECIFCKIVKSEIPAEKVYEDDNFLAIKDVNPKVKGHTLLIPKKHFRKVIDLPSTIGTEMLDALKKTTLKVMSENDSEGFNLAVVGEDVDHAHIHILPRKKDDNFKLFNS